MTARMIDSSHGIDAFLTDLPRGLNRLFTTERINSERYSGLQEFIIVDKVQDLKKRARHPNQGPRLVTILILPANSAAALSSFPYCKWNLF